MTLDHRRIRDGLPRGKCYVTPGKPAVSAYGLKLPEFHTINSHSFRMRFRAYLDHLMTTGDRVQIYRHGHEVAALVCREDFDALEEITTEKPIR